LCRTIDLTDKKRKPAVITTTGEDKRGRMRAAKEGVRLGVCHALETTAAVVLLLHQYNVQPVQKVAQSGEFLLRNR
jgi:hypothetical protein